MLLHHEVGCHVAIEAVDCCWQLAWLGCNHTYGSIDHRASSHSMGVGAKNQIPMQLTPREGLYHPNRFVNPHQTVRQVAVRPPCTEVMQVEDYEWMPIVVVLRGRFRPSRGRTHFSPQTRVGPGGFRLILVRRPWVSTLRRRGNLRAVDRKASRRLRGSSQAGPRGAMGWRRALGPRSLSGLGPLGLAVPVGARYREDGHGKPSLAPSPGGAWCPGRHSADAVRLPGSGNSAGAGVRHPATPGALPQGR